MISWYWFVISLLAWGAINYCLGFCSAGWMFRAGIKDALLGLPHPKALVQAAAREMKSGAFLDQPMYPVRKEDEFGDRL